MNKSFLLPLMLLTLQSVAQKRLPMLEQPVARKEAIKDNYFGQDIQDPYRWLEDDNSQETALWVRQQNLVTFDYLQKIPFRDKVGKELTRMWNYEKYGSPMKEGEYFLFYKNDGLQNQSVLYIQKGLNGEPQEFLNPNTMNKEGTSSLGSISLSKNQKFCAYSVSNAGSDWQDIYVMDVESKAKTKDVINYSKFSGIAWKGDEGFYYSGYDKPAESGKYSAKTEYQKIFFHKMGTAQSDDKLVYEDKEHPLRYKGAALTEDERWLMLSISEGTDGSELYFMDLQDKTKKTFTLLCKGFSSNFDFVDNIDGKFLVYTNYQAANYQLVLIDPQQPEPSNWKKFLPEASNKLDAVNRVGDKVFCTYLINAASQVNVYDLKGAILSTIDLPGIGTASGFGGSKKDDITFYTYTSFNAPPMIFKYDLKTGKSELFKQPNLKTDLGNTVVEQIWFKSKDGTRVPMFIYHRADVDIRKGPHPVFLYGYGGFNISLTPSFSIPMSYFVQKGGIYVCVSLRGGSEFGEKWHEGGKLENKQNVFDDFIGAAESLITSGVTSKEMLAIHGRSNGGLLVGACMTQRPDLFQVCLPGVGVLDMLRYHKFTVGWGWAVEYGSSDKKEDFNYLIKYSPLHNVKKGAKYPATMVTTADHDDRVVPAHSFKFAAALQDANASTNPMLIRIDTQAGHGAGKPTSKQIDEWADVLSFTMYHLGMDGFK
ncbi:MAG: S9 family peptidase [Bacteroidetes bacterium]|nr:S9 family peptidase [Bacteroidota bacterium]